MQLYVDAMELTVEPQIRRGDGGKVSGVGIAKTVHGTAIGYGSVITTDQSVSIAKKEYWLSLQDLLAQLLLSLCQAPCIKRFRIGEEGSLTFRLMDSSCTVPSMNDSKLVNEYLGCIWLKEAMARSEFQTLQKHDLDGTNRRPFVLPRSLLCLESARRSLLFIRDLLRVLFLEKRRSFFYRRLPCWISV